MTEISPQWPVLAPQDAVVADVLLSLAGLLRHPDPLGESVPEPAAQDWSDEAPTALRVAPPLAERATAARHLVLADAESTPVALLSDVRHRPGDADVVEGRLQALRPPTLSRGSDGSRGTPVLGAGTDGTVVVLGRPPLAEDLRQAAPGQLVLVVPVAGPSPDGVPAAALLRIARSEAARTGGAVLPLPLAWRDPVSDRALVEHVLTGLGARRGVHLRPARDPDTALHDAADAAWRQLLCALRDGSRDLPDVGTPATLEELRRWRRPRRERGLVVLFTGLSGSGKSTLARALAAHLAETGERTVSLLDGDVVRRLLSSGLGFTPEDRDLNVRRIGYVAAEVARHGGVAICAPIAPYARSRAAVRAMVEEVGDLVLVHVSTSVEECERRDLKGLYAKARAGEVPAFTGISDPYEEPLDADVTVDTAALSPGGALASVLDHLATGGWISRA